MCSFTWWEQALGICNQDPMCVFLADILLIQSNTGTPVDPLVVRSGGQPKTGKKKRERRRETKKDGERDKWQVLNISSLATCKPI